MASGNILLYSLKKVPIGSVLVFGPFIEWQISQFGQGNIPVPDPLFLCSNICSSVSFLSVLMSVIWFLLW